jgi:transcriptional regulator with XRE-family HTH domain
MNTDERIRLAIREAMNDKGLTQQELADKLGIKQPSVAQLISGKYGAIPQSLLDVLEALDLELVVQAKKKR